jgi:hypothetical protein
MVKNKAQQKKLTREKKDEKKSYCRKNKEWT